MDFSSAQSQSHDDDFILNIKFSDKRSFYISVNPNNTIAEIKLILRKEADLLASSKVSLVFVGQVLKDNATAEVCGLGEQTTLHALCLSEEELETFDSGKQPQLRANLSQFFVYCKICGCVRPALLRVECKLCKSGLFVVSRGPSGWEDVISTTSLKGNCQNEQCTSDEPRFYFICAQRHQGEVAGTAAVLCHVQSNHRQVECITCQDIAAHVLIFPCPPGHVMCLDCFRMYAISSLQERQFVEHPVHGYTLPCPAGCDEAFIEDSHHFLLMGMDMYERYKNFGAEEFVLKNGGVLCPSPNCGMGIFLDEDSRLIKCSECKFESCRDCKRPYHLDSCENSLLAEINCPAALSIDPQRAERASWERQSLSLIGEISKPCPGCATKTERDGGCMHIQCSRCGAEWCWLCVKPWDRECQASHWFG